MNKIHTDIWKLRGSPDWVGITTNGAINREGRCVMGRGVALEAAKLFPHLPYELAKKIEEFGNKVFFFPQYGIFTFPVKHIWYQKADLKLIQQSAVQLYAHMMKDYPMGTFYLVPPGCGNGKLSWDEVEPVLSGVFGSTERLVIVDREMA